MKQLLQAPGFRLPTIIMILITGASRGIGKYLYKYFATKGDEVYGTYNSTTPENIKGLTKVDISRYNEVESWIQSIPNLNEIKLINCAAIADSSFAHKCKIEEWHKVIDINVKGTFNTIRALLPIMRGQGYGRIINFSSVIAQKGTPGVSAYAASKSALWGMAKSLATENASKGISVNNINLGYVNLGMGLEQVPEQMQETLKKQIPLGRFCEPEEMVATIEYLIKTPYINGSSVDLNGGLI